MKLKMQIISLLLWFCGAILYGSENIDLDDEKNWPEYSTEAFDYKKVITVKPANSIDVFDNLSQIFFTKDDSPEKISQSNNLFSTGVTRTKVSKRSVGDNIEITIETWTTANSSYFTGTNLLVLMGLTANPNWMDKNYGCFFKYQIPYVRKSLNVIGIASSDFLHTILFAYQNNDYQRRQLKNSLIDVITDPLLITGGIMIAGYYAYKNYLESQKIAKEKALQDTKMIHK